ncbi:MAG: hypothetical protein ACKOXB_14310 [Flavobacteriales bacterium]
MKKLFSFFAGLLLLFSCNVDTNEITPVVPTALQDNKLEIKSYSRNDLIDELYHELTEKNPELQKLEEVLDGLHEKSQNVTGKFEAFNDKSQSYYLSASAHLSNIKDSLTRKKMQVLVNKSNLIYTMKKAGIDNLIKQINSNNLSLADHHTVLKILLTLPLIEKYQEENIPGAKDFKAFAKEQGDILKEINRLTPQ